MISYTDALIRFDRKTAHLWSLVAEAVGDLMTCLTKGDIPRTVAFQHEADRRFLEVLSYTAPYLRDRFKPLEFGGLRVEYHDSEGMWAAHYFGATDDGSPYVEVRPIASVHYTDSKFYAMIQFRNYSVYTHAQSTPEDALVELKSIIQRGKKDPTAPAQELYTWLEGRLWLRNP